MDYRKIDLGACNLHLIHTDRFKTVTIRVCLRDTVKKEEITLRNFLTTFLTYSTDTYRSKREMVLHAQDLYAANIYTKSYRSGNQNMVNFYLSTLNEKYTEEGMLDKTVNFLNDIIFHPNFNDIDSYNRAYDFLYKNFEVAIRSLKENPTMYSMIRMLEEMDSDKPYSYREIGYLDDLNKITITNLKEYYKKLINNSLVDIYVIGDFIDDEIINIIKKYMIFDTFKRPKKAQIIYHDTMPKRVKIKKELVDSNQSKLTIGCKIGKLSEFDLNYTLSLYNMILGGTSESKFFQIIREKYSLAYYVYSNLNKLDSLMIIKAGIARENFDKTVKLIKKLMKEIENGNFSDESFTFAKQNYLSLLKEVEDNENAIIETYIAKDLLNLATIDKRSKEIEKVTREDIIRVAKKVKIDTIFLLEGKIADEGN